MKNEMISEELINSNRQLQKQLSTLEKKIWIEDTAQKLVYKLGERAKELSCLNDISQVIFKPNNVLDQLLQGTVELIPPIWQYPEITGAKIVLKNKQFTTPDCMETPWQISAEISVCGGPIGTLKIFYQEDLHTTNDPFAQEQIVLLSRIAEYLGKEIERIAAEEALQNSNAQLSMILESINDGFFVLDNNLVITYFNQSAEELLNRKKTDVLGKHFLEAFPEAMGSIFEEKYRWAIQEKKSLLFETYFDIAPYQNWYDVRVFPFQNGISIHFRIITERKLAEIAQQKLSFELSIRVKELTCLYNISKLIMMPNNSLDKILQSSAELIPSAWQFPELTCARITLNDKEFKTQNYADSPWKLTAPLHVHGEIKGTIEVSYLKEFPAQDEGPFLNGERDLLDAIAERLGRVTERIHAEQALRASEEKFRKMIESSPDAITVSDINATIIDCNQEKLKMHGFSSKEEVIGKKNL